MFVFVLQNRNLTAFGCGVTWVALFPGTNIYKSSWVGMVALVSKKCEQRLTFFCWDSSESLIEISQSNFHTPDGLIKCLQSNFHTSGNFDCQLSVEVSHSPWNFDLNLQSNFHYPYENLQRQCQSNCHTSL